MRFKLDASSAKQASLQSENDKAKANEQHAEHRASIAEMSANDAAAAGSLRELAAKLLDDQEDPSIGAARMLDRVWDLVDELLAFAGFGAAQDALRAERTCPGRQPPPVAAFLGAGEAQKYANTAADSLIECLQGRTTRATFEKRWLACTYTRTTSASVGSVTRHLRCSYLPWVRVGNEDEHTI